MNFKLAFGFVLVGAFGIVLPLAVSVRLVLRPIMEAMVRLREMMVPAGGDRTQALEGEIQQLRTEISWLGREVKRLSEAEGFYQQLLISGRGDVLPDRVSGTAEGEKAHGLSDATEHQRITTG